ncbi:APC family permease [Segetibacter sp.]|jgi:APA family basic amino acid/polyamine antiporter|uniref:APC family permease n=1 Tax=Segetibacter sp. TaxID=2231182 RepID=UPI002609F18F|nr:APC family permease [Segetibacter sp.]MCW3081035.1 serine/threonine protein kinase [Segetibacter sp.]
MQTKTKLNIFDFTMIVVSLVIGMGIFRTPANVAAAVPTPFAFFVVWLAGGLVALCGALTYAEIGSRFPVTGAYYKIFSYCYHPSIAFAINCIILVSNAASLAGVALIGAEYITKVIAPNATDAQFIQIGIAIFSIAVFYGVNLLGLKMSAKAQNVLTIIKISMILLLMAPLFFVTPSVSLIPETLQHVSPAFTEYIKAFGIGLVAVSFTYGGYQQTINFGADVENPRRNIPRGIFIGIFVIITLYLAINYAYIRVIGFDNLKGAKNIAAIMASHVFGDAAGRILSVLLFLSVLAYVNVLLMSNPRVMYAMSEDNVLPKIFGVKNERTNVLTTSLSVFAAICILIVFWAKEFDEILSFTIFLDCIGMATSAATIFILRKRTAHLDETKIYTVGLYPLLPLIFIAAYIFVAISIFIDRPATALTALAVLAGFTILYFITKGTQNQPKQV